jgi:putative SOS response-associated peptidase YedK
MCGRYVATSPPDVLAEYFAVDEVRAEAEGPSFNVAPTDMVPAVVSRGGQRRLGLLRWGLVPSWSKDTRGAARMINARAESLRTKPAFRTAFSRRRCIIAADGFYEWQRHAGGKQPWLIHRADGAPLAMAGLWELWRPTEDAEWVRTCAIVTTPANGLMAPIHDRMPAVLEPRDWELWLDEDEDDPDELDGLLRPAADHLLERYRVSDRVNSVRNNGPELLEPASAACRPQTGR